MPLFSTPLQQPVYVANGLMLSNGVASQSKRKASRGSHDAIFQRRAKVAKRGGGRGGRGGSAGSVS
eukprot:2788597-Rhodomonas_salina.1